MSRKDYVAVAAIIQRRVEAGSDADRELLHGLANDLAGLFAADNWAFDRTRFLVACGLVP